MTKLRPVATFYAGIMSAIVAIGRDDISRIVGKSYQFLRQCADEDDDGHHLTVRDAIKLDAACARLGVGTPILDGYRSQVRRASAEKADGDPMEALVRVMAEVGDLAGVLRDALAERSAGGRTITVEELRALLRGRARPRRRRPAGGRRAARFRPPFTSGGRVVSEAPRLSADTRLLLALAAATLGSPSSADLDRLRETLRAVEDEPFVDRRLIAAARGLIDGRLSREQAGAVVATRGEGPRPRPSAAFPYSARSSKPGATHVARSAVGDTSC